MIIISLLLFSGWIAVVSSMILIGADLIDPVISLNAAGQIGLGGGEDHGLAIERPRDRIPRELD